MFPKPQVAQIVEREERTRLCESILRSLPEWFGIESAIQEYVREVGGLPTFAASPPGLETRHGFLALRHHNPFSAEIYVMGVRPEFHGRGLGAALIAAAEELLCARAVEYLQVKTLGPSRPSRGYERTRRFYEAQGFRPLEEIHGLWEGNPCLILVKRLEPPAGDR